MDSLAKPNADANTSGLALLASLIGFVKPTTPDPIIIQLCNSEQGQALLKTMVGFVNLVISCGEDTGVNDWEQKDVSMPHTIEEKSIEGRSNVMPPAKELISDYDADEFLLMCNLVDVYPPLYELPREIIDAVHDRVFNHMPIRMISFDASGNNCTLVNRNELCQIILARTLAEYTAKLDRKINMKGFPGAEKFLRKHWRYAILSHTWLRDMPGDVLFHDWAKRTLPQNTRGNAKISNFCSVAAQEHGVLLGWMDTVCINKESSSELDESIRSMFAWYQRADVCITYLGETMQFWEIPKDTWFTRSWTLQELLANRNICFYSREWTRLLPGDFTEHINNPEFLPIWVPSMFIEMQYQIFIATSIKPEEFVNPVSLSICRIMELAARRNVTRAEDHIYSLMGLLGVNMPVAYGEGSRNALRRMITQIMSSWKNFLDLFNHTNDYSILPDMITDYIGHTKLAHQYAIPQAPIVLSHLGVHATFLAIPLFKEGSYPAQSSIGSISWKYDNPWGDPESNYHALDDSSLSIEWISKLGIDLNRRSPHEMIKMDDPPFIFLAIILSQVDQDHGYIQLSVGQNLGIPVLPDLFNPSDEAVRVSFTDISPLNQLASNAQKRGPHRISLDYRGSNVSHNGVLTLTTEEAKQMGFRVITGHFY